MLEKTKAIVISTIKYQEKSLIVKCFTEARGLKSYFIRDAFSSKRSAQKIAYFQPLTLLQIEADHKDKGGLSYLKEIKLFAPYYTIGSDIRKTTIVLFISEILYSCIKEEEENHTLYSFLETALLWLDSHTETINFHLILLLEITKFLGFYPVLPQDSEIYFEMSEGVFTSHETTTCLNREETLLFKKLLSLKFDTPGKIFHVTERQQLLTLLLKYYELHLGSFKKPKSLEILREVFSV